MEEEESDILNYKKSDKELIEKTGRYKYYDFTEETIIEIINKDVEDVTVREWRTLIQMMYPQNLIASGLIDDVLIFKMSKDGQRIDPPMEAYSSIITVQNKTCLLSMIMSTVKLANYHKCHPSWYKKSAEVDPLNPKFENEEQK